ncbi:MAG: PilZ domain-containing protein [Candidatus Omnitrophica bacterium]|nr:PilZ domain-containing protein [Candidatus Omnitrophota bacterium]
MRERRTTVRVNCFLPTQYHLVDSPAMSSGQVTNLSAEGLRLLATSPLQDDERVRLSFSLPNGQEAAVAVQGIVRWRQPDAATDQGHSVGVEFEGLDETTRFCLQSFIAEQAQREPHTNGFGRRMRRLRTSSLIRVLKIGWPLVIGLVGAGGCVWILSLQRQQEQLRSTIAERAAIITQLEAQHQQLQQELGQARAAASSAGTEVEQLQAQRSQSETQIAALTQNLGELQQAYRQLREERDALKQWVQALEHQQQALEQRLKSVPELHKALRQAYRVRAKERLERWQQWLARPHGAPSDTLVEGNGGYLIRGGQPTTASSRLSIRVLDPTAEPSP